MEKFKHFIFTGYLLLIAFVLAFNTHLLAKDIDTSLKVKEKQTSTPKVIYFYAPWCSACQKFGPMLKKTLSKYSNQIDFQSVNIDDPMNRSLVNKFQIHAIPATFIYDRNSKVVFGKSGLVNEQIISKVLNNINADTNLRQVANTKSTI